MRRVRISCRLRPGLATVLRAAAKARGVTPATLFVVLLSPRLRRLAAAAALLVAFSGCTFWRGKQAKVEAATTTNAAKLDESARQLTTGALDAVTLAPVNPPTALAKKFLQRDQEILGAPVQRIDVDALLISNVTAMAELTKTFNDQRQLLDERSELQAKLAASTAKLVEMGKAYEAEHNRNILSRIWHWAMGTLGLGGLIALCVFCPAAMPIIGWAVSHAVSVFPLLANYLGVVGKKAFDSTLRAVGDVRTELKTLAAHPATAGVPISPAAVLTLLDNSLVAQQAGHANLIAARRDINNV